MMIDISWYWITNRGPRGSQRVLVSVILSWLRFYGQKLRHNSMLLWTFDAQIDAHLMTEQLDSETSNNDPRRAPTLPQTF